MKRWYRVLMGILAASAAGLTFMGAALMRHKNEMPAVIGLTAGGIADFAPVTVSARLLDNDHDSIHWWEQTISFGEEVQTESRFVSGGKPAAFIESLRHASALQPNDWLWQDYTGGDGSRSGTYYVSDSTDHYSYSVHIWEEWEDGTMLFADVEYPWLRSAVGSDDKVVIEDYGNGSSIRSHTSSFNGDIQLIRADGKYFFTLPNTFHGTTARKEDGTELETVAYSGSSGIFQLLQEEDGSLVYEWDDGGGLAQAEQLFALPISDELSNIVIRLDHMEKLGLLSLLTAEDGRLVLRLCDIGTGECGGPIDLGEAYVNGLDAGDSIPDDVRLKVQGDLILILRGGFGDQPSRATAVQVKTLNKAEILLDTVFDIENRNYRNDSWMAYEDGVLYFLEGNEWWSGSLRIAAVDENGVKAAGVLQNRTAEIESEHAMHNFDFDPHLPELLQSALTDTVGWDSIELDLKK